MESGVEAQINYLSNNDLKERISNNKLKINVKGRIYNQDKQPSKILTRVVGSLYKKQFPKESKPKRRIRNVKGKPAGSADALLKLNDKRADDKRFPGFQLECDYSQDPDAHNDT